MDVRTSYELTPDELERSFAAMRAIRLHDLRAWNGILGGVGLFVLLVDHGWWPVSLLIWALAATYTRMGIRTLKRAIPSLQTLECVPREVWFSADGFAIEDQHRTSTWRWSAFVKAETNGEFLLLYTAAYSAFAVPIRAFDQSQLAEIRAFFAERFATAAATR